MKNRTMAIIGAVVFGVLGFVWLGTEAPQGATVQLTGADHAEIERLYGLYNQGSDFRDAEMWLSAFAEDAVFTTPAGETKGQAALRQAREERYQGLTGDNSRRHYNSSFVITATESGAKARAYWLVNDVSGTEPTAVSSGYYDDTFVKTATGWKIQTRTLHRDPAVE